eukprot:2088652-Rhodomonas_salina.2
MHVEPQFLIRPRALPPHKADREPKTLEGAETRGGDGAEQAGEGVFREWHEHLRCMREASFKAFPTVSPGPATLLSGQGRSVLVMLIVCLVDGGWGDVVRGTAGGYLGKKVQKAAEDRKHQAAKEAFRRLLRDPDATIETASMSTL